MDAACMMGQHCVTTHLGTGKHEIRTEGEVLFSAGEYVDSEHGDVVADDVFVVYYIYERLG